MNGTSFPKTDFDDKKLLSYGFRYENGSYILSRNIVDGQLTAQFTLHAGYISCKVYDTFDGSEYTLHMSPNADGSFVNLVRHETESTISDIIAHCAKSIHRFNTCADNVMEYCLNKYGDSFEYLWDNSPDAAAIRRRDNRKWYGVLMKISSEKLGLLPSRNINVINLHVDADELSSLIEKDSIFPAYHMNKKHWVTVILDGSMKTEELFRLIDRSYELGSDTKGKRLK